MKPKIIIAIAMATLMVLLALSSVIGEQQNSSTASGTKSLSNVSVGKAIKAPNLTIQELQALKEFEVYNLLNYGIHSNNLSKLEFKANLNFISWYATNYTQIPVSHRVINRQNASVILTLWEKNSPNANADVQAVANYEVSQNTIKNQLNTSYIVDNHLGTIISIKNTNYNNKTANLVTYEYTKDNSSLIYALINVNGKFVPVDPYIRLNAFTIHWGWLGLISGTSYNIYLTFTNYNSASSFENFLVNAANIAQWATFSETAAFWIVVTTFSGPAAPIVAIAGVLETLWGQGDPLTAAQNVNDIFQNQEAYNNQFTIVYTLNAWESGLVPEYSWWGYMYNDPSPGQQTLTQVFKSVGFASSAEANYIATYNFLTGIYGTNIQQSFNGPSDWFSIASTLAALE